MLDIDNTQNGVVVFPTHSSAFNYSCNKKSLIDEIKQKGIIINENENILSVEFNLTDNYLDSNPQAKRIHDEHNKINESHREIITFDDLCDEADQEDDNDVYFELSTNDKLFSNMVWQKKNVLVFTTENLTAIKLRIGMIMSQVTNRLIFNKRFSDTVNILDLCPNSNNENFFVKYDPGCLNKRQVAEYDQFYRLKREIPEFHWLQAVKDARAVIYDPDYFLTIDQHFYDDEGAGEDEEKYAIKKSIQAYKSNNFEYNEPLYYERLLLNTIKLMLSAKKFCSISYDDASDDPDVIMKMGDDIQAIVKWL